MAYPFIGEIQIFGCNYAPAGWAFCNGALLDISQNPTLFSLVGTLYGGNGNTNFNLPDLRSRVAIGMGQGPGLSPHDVGDTLGEDSVSLMHSEMPPHTHGLQVAFGPDGRTAAPQPGQVLTSPVNSRFFRAGVPANTALAPQAITPAGGGLPHENRQPVLAMNLCIALNGIYPSFG